DRTVTGVQTCALPICIRIGSHEAGRDAVDGNAIRSQFVRKLAREMDQSSFGGGVGLYPGQADVESRPAGNRHDPALSSAFHPAEIGRASCRERVEMRG